MGFYIPPVKVKLEEYAYWHDAHFRTCISYSDANYLQPGMASRLRIRHFEEALKMASERFHNANVIDFGCADGPLLPSLAKYFNHVIGIDKNPTFIQISSKVVEAMHLENVELIYSDNLMLEDVRSKMGGGKYQILFLLETLEHVGNKSALWESRVNFIRELFSLLDEEGIIIISVPIMIGISFLLQRLGFLLLNVKNQENLSLSDYLKASLLNDTTKLENRWQGGHLGFNHKKLEFHLKKNFRVLEKKNITFQVMYKLAR